MRSEAIETHPVQKGYWRLPMQVGSESANLLARGRRTHGVFGTEEEACKAAYDLAYLMNGVPFGYRFATLRRMGAVSLISYRTSL